MGNAAAPAVEAFRASDGYQFLYRRWTPAGRPLARVLFLHGIRSHGGWYGRSCGELADAGYEVLFLDRRGSGMNTAHRGDVPNFRRWLDDVIELILSERRSRPWLRTVVGGISWGGKLAAGLPYRAPGLVGGVMLLCPGLAPLVRPSAGLRARIAAAAAVRPRKLFPIPLNEPALFTADPQWQAFIDADPHGLRLATARFLFQSVALDVYLKRAVKRIDMPVLLMLAGRERVIDNARTREKVAKFGTTDVTVKEYPEAGHTLEFEPPGCGFAADMAAWLGAEAV